MGICSKGVLIVMNFLNEQYMKKEINIENELVNSIHKFPVNVANEIVRMRKRVLSLSEEATGKLQLTKSLDRLVEDLKEIGYEIPELLYHEYDEGMMVHARFIIVENLVKDEKHITKVIRPAVTYKGELIQVAEVEVSIKV